MARLHYPQLNSKLTFVRNATNKRNVNQLSFWGDTYLTPQEANIYLQQMLQTLKRYKDKTENK